LFSSPPSVGSGLFHDVPPDVQNPLYADAVAALEEVDRVYFSGLDAAGWDWALGKQKRPATKVRWPAVSP
jgi:hypothetical protein